MEKEQGLTSGDDNNQTRVNVNALLNAQQKMGRV
jgi:hypothetical protein